MRQVDTAGPGRSQARLSWDGNDAPETFPQAISRALEDLRLPVERGGIGVTRLCRCFDGREGETVAESTISRWISEPRRFPLLFGPVLMELHPGFRANAFRYLSATFVTPERVISRLSGPAARQVQEAVRALWVEEAGPGRWVRR